MANTDYNFQYTPLTGRLPGNSFVKQTEQAINELAGIVNKGSAQVEVITNLANTANENSEEALEKANEALETSGRVYITLPNLDDADDYYDSQLYYFANSYSHNLPVQDTGFLEVKTNDTKTAAEQVFIADATGLVYMRHGTITSSEVGGETVYSVTWGLWSSELASQDYVQQEVNLGISTSNSYTDTEVAKCLPLAGGTMGGSIVSAYDYKSPTDSNKFSAFAGTDNTGSCFVMYGKNHPDYAGYFQLKCSDGANVVNLIGNASGSLTWGGHEVVTDAQETYTISMSPVSNQIASFIKKGNVCMVYLPDITNLPAGNTDVTALAPVKPANVWKGYYNDGSHRIYIGIYPDGRVNFYNYTSAITSETALYITPVYVCG